MTIAELTVMVNKISDEIHGNGKDGMKSDIKGLKTNFKFLWLVLLLLMSLSGAIFAKLYF